MTAALARYSRLNRRAAPGAAGTMRRHDARFATRLAGLAASLALLAARAARPGPRRRRHLASTARPSSPPSTPPTGLRPASGRRRSCMTPRLGRLPRRDRRRRRPARRPATSAPGALRRAGFNVLTWDSRGLRRVGRHRDRRLARTSRGATSRRCSTGSPSSRRRSSTAPGDPRVGMHGASYAGGIELVSAGHRPADRRDRARHRLALAADLALQGGDGQGRLGLALFGGGLPTAALEGAVRRPACRPARWTRTSRAPSRTGVSTGKLSAEDRAWFDSRGPSDLVGADPRADAAGPGHRRHAVHALARRSATTRSCAATACPLKMIWFCGGHGACLTGAGRGGPRRARRRGVDEAPPRGDARRRHRPALRVARRRRRSWRSAADFPPPAGTPIVAEGSGHAGRLPGRRRLRHARSPPARPSTRSPCRARRRAARRQVVGRAAR